MSERKKPLRWRREDIGSTWTSTVRGYDLVRGGEVLAYVRPIPRNQAKWWYWYANGVNTSDRPVILAVAKDEAKTWAAAKIKGKS